MKHLAPFILLLGASVAGSFAQQAGAPAAQPADALKPAFAIIQRIYPRAEIQRFPKAPADTVWQFRSTSAATGTVEVGFQGDQVLYMIFRRGTGGVAWKANEIRALQNGYSDLLKGGRYKSGLAPHINGATITRADFEAKNLSDGSL